MPTYTPPASVAANAQRALDVRRDKPPSEQGMTAVGLARANQLAQRRPVSIETIQRMVSYFARHEVDKQGSTWDEQGKGWQAWYGWGGDEGYAWARDILERYNMSSTKAGQRHSESDMQILRSMRSTTKAYHDGMMKMYADMGDDFVYSDSATDMQAQATVAQPVPPSLKAMPETTAEVLMLIHAWQLQLWYTACASIYNCSTQEVCCHALEDVKETAGSNRYQVMNKLAERGTLIPVTLSELCMMVPEASITPTTNDGTIILENVNALNNTLIDVLRASIPVVIAEQQYDIQLMLQQLLSDYNALSFTLARAMAGVYDDGEGAQESESAESDDGEDMADDYAILAQADRDTTPAEREDMPAGDFVIPETRNFPIVTPDDIPAAVSSWGRYRGEVTFEQFKSRLIALATRKGREFVDALPQAWRDEMAQRVARALIRY